jgi:hypothetical protein
MKAQRIPGGPSGINCTVCDEPAHVMVEAARGANYYVPRCANHEESPINPTDRFTDLEVASISDAAEQLDDLWDFDSKREIKDLKYGAEYYRAASAPNLRRIIGEAEPT